MKQPTSADLAKNAPRRDAPPSEVQHWMMSLLRHKEDLNESPELCAAAATHFTGSKRLSPAEQIDIYRQQFWLRHTSILIDDFPGLSSLLGQREWERTAEEFLSTLGYQVFSLADFGAQLPQHLEETCDLKNRDLYVDMARLECAYEHAFTARNDSPLSAERVSAIPASAWATARFATSHSLHLLQVRYPVAHMRRKLRKQPDCFANVDVFESEPANVVVYRRERILYDKAISEPAFLLLAEFQNGSPLVAACENVIAQHPAAEAAIDEELASWFGLWGRLGWITDVILP